MIYCVRLSWFCGSMWQHVAACGSMWQHVAVCGSMWQHVVLSYPRNSSHLIECEISLPHSQEPTISPCSKADQSQSTVIMFVKVKVNQSHYRLGRPRRSQEVKVPRFRDNGTGWWQVVSLTYRPPLPPGNTPCTHFY